MLPLLKNNAGNVSHPSPEVWISFSTPLSLVSLLYCGAALSQAQLMNPQQILASCFINTAEAGSNGVCLVCRWVFAGVGFADDTKMIILTCSTTYIMSAKWNICIGGHLQLRLSDLGDSDFCKTGMLPENVML